MSDELHWGTQELPAGRLQEWLLYPGSFMQRLRNHGVKNPQVQVLSQRWQYPLSEEKKLLGCSCSRFYMLVREVLISSGKKNWMFARSVFPRTTLTGQQQRLARLKTRSLGSVLFNDPSTERSAFEMARVDAGMKYHAIISRYTELAHESIWARRSIFLINNKPLLLTEFFLPEMMSL